MKTSLFTPRQLLVADLTAEGKKPGAVAWEMKISPRTAEFYRDHMYRIMAKAIGVTDFEQRELVHLWLRLHRIEPLYATVNCAPLLETVEKRPKELQAATLTAKGLTRAKAAQEMGITESTVDSHLEKFYASCKEYFGDLEFTRVHLVHLMYELGKIELLFPDAEERLKKFLLSEAQLEEARKAARSLECRKLNRLQGWVAILVGQGLHYAEIGRKCGLRQRSVETTVTNVYRAFGERFHNPNFKRRQLIEILAKHPDATPDTIVTLGIDS